jgi:hypothetical protein
MIKITNITLANIFTIYTMKNKVNGVKIDTYYDYLLLNITVTVFQ